MRQSKKNTIDGKNQVRQKIKNIFKQRKCFTLSRPVHDEHQLRNIQDLNYKELREKFRLEVEELTYYV